VSVVLTTYNRASILPATIKSVLDQTFSDFELIVCDDCSTDSTESILREYALGDSRIQYHENKRTLGMPSNLNAGIALAHGEYVANLHDDDEYSPVLLERWIQVLDRYPSAGFVFNAYRSLGPGGREHRVYREPLSECQPGCVVIERVFFRRWRFDSPVWGTTMVRRSAYEMVGPFDERFGFFADVDMWLRLADRFDVAYVDEPLIGLRSPEQVPRRWRTSWLEEQRIVERMFWEARIRHFEGRPGRLSLELARHVLHLAAARSYNGALAVRREARRFWAGRNGAR
jgi:glycosyltransferase involved in cell wall biosynthesis